MLTLEGSEEGYSSYIWICGILENSCSDLNYEDCVVSENCEWMSDSPGGLNGMCVEASDWECNPDLECAQVLTCFDGFYYPTSCGPLNCDLALYPCDEEDNCEGLGHQECMMMEDCEWIFDDDSTDFGYCIDLEEEDDDDIPECVLDCEGIENVNPEENPTDFCEWMLPTYESGCTDDCEDDVAIEVETYLALCQFCLEFENCDDVFNGGLDDTPNLDCLLEDCTFDNMPDSDNSSEFCQFWVDTDFSDCTGGCDEEVITFIVLLDGMCDICLELGNCDEIFSEECEDLDYEDCLEDDDCQVNYNAAGQFEGCEESNNTSDMGYLYGRVEYIYGDYIDFVPDAPIHIVSSDSLSPNMYIYETMTDFNGNYDIYLPEGYYVVTAYAEGESQDQDIYLEVGNEHELNFLLGEFGGPGFPDAILSLGDDEIIGTPGQELVLPLYLYSGMSSVGGVQFTIAGETNDYFSYMFPEGIESMDGCFTANFNEIYGQFIGIIFSFEGCAYPAGDSIHIANLHFSVDYDVPVGIEIPLYFVETIVSDNIGIEIPSYGEGNTVHIGSLGDINADGEINVLDVVLAVSFAIDIEEPNESEFWASDLNGDNMINVLDIVQLINLILGD